MLRYFSPLNVALSATYFGNTTGPSSGLPSHFCLSTLPPSFIVCVYLFLALNLLLRLVIRCSRISRDLGWKYLSDWSSRGYQSLYPLRILGGPCTSCSQARRYLALEGGPSEVWHLAAPVLGGQPFLFRYGYIDCTTQYWSQGLTWVVVFTLASLPPVVRLLSNEFKTFV